MDGVTVLVGDARSMLRTLPDASVHCCVTSPPYWGLRDYGTGTWEGGDAVCDHIRQSDASRQSSTLGGSADTQGGKVAYSHTCGKCGAIRVDNQIGLEETPEAYVAELVEVFREVRRVLRDDGTVWLNLASTYVSAIIESERYVLREDLTESEYGKVQKGIAGWLSTEQTPVPSVRQTDEPTKSAMPSVLDEAALAPRKLHNTGVQEVRKGVHSTQVANLTEPGEVLQPVVREIGQPHQEENGSDCAVPDVRKKVQQAQVGDTQDSGQVPFLQPRVFLQSQPAGQPLSLAGRPARQNEPRGDKVAEGRAQAGQESLPALPEEPKTGSASHPSVCGLSETAMGRKQRDNVVPQLPRTTAKQGNGTRGDIDIHSIGPPGCLDGLTLLKRNIPDDLLQFFCTAYRLRPKDDAGIPWRVAFALQADGWYLRQDIIWHKPSPMPESVTDRCTKAHEYIFLLSKSARYWYDAEAIKEPSVIGKGAVRNMGTKDKGESGSRKDGGRVGIINDGTRNRRSVWTVSTRNYSAAHFATFPPALIEPCILAGCPIDGTVLDPFGGSGTTAGVALKHNRKAILCELNPEYADLVEARVKSIAGDYPLFET